MANNRFFQNTFAAGKTPASSLRPDELKEAVEFSNFLLDIYTLEQANVPGNLGSVLLNEEATVKKGGVRASNRISLIERGRDGADSGGKAIKEAVNRLKSNELTYAIELSQRTLKEKKRLRSKFSSSLKRDQPRPSSREQSLASGSGSQMAESLAGLRGSKTSENNPLNRALSPQQPLLLSATKVQLGGLNSGLPASMQRIPKSPNQKPGLTPEPQPSINPNMIAMLQQKKVFGASKTGDSGSSIFAKFIKTKTEDKQKIKAAITVNEKAKSKILNDLKSMDAFQKRGVQPSPQPVVKCDDLASKRVPDVSNSTFRQTAEFTVVPDSTFSFQANDPDPKFESEASIRLNEPMNLEEAIKRASMKNKTKRDTFYKEHSKLSVIEEVSMMEGTPASPMLDKSLVGPRRDRGRRGDESSDARAVSGLKTKNRSFLEQIQEIAENSKIKDTSMRKSGLLDRSQDRGAATPNTKEHAEEQPVGRSSLRRNSHEKIKEIARSHSSKTAYQPVPVPKSEQRYDVSGASSIFANVTQKYSFFKPSKPEHSEAGPGSTPELPGEAPKASIRALSNNLKSFSKTQLDPNYNPASASILLKTKMAGATYAEPEKYRDLAVESTNQSSSKEAPLRKDSNITLNIKKLPRKISVDMGHCFKK